MGQQDKITARQLAVLTFAALLSPVIRILPRMSVAAAGNGAWLSVIPGTAAGLLYLLFVKRTFKNRMPGEGLTELFCRSIGNAGGKLAASVCALWLVFYGGFITRAAAERLLSAVYQNGTTAIFIAVIPAVALIASSGSVRALTRTAELVTLVIVFVLAFVTVSSLKQVRSENLLPVSFSDTGAIFAGALPVIDIAGTGIYFFFLAGHVEDGEKPAAKSVKFFLLLMAAAFAVTFVTAGAFSPELILKFQSPFFMVVRNIEVLGVVERIEALVIAAWVLTDFMLLASALTAAGEIMCSVFKTEKRRLFTIPAAAVCAFIAFFMVREEFTLQLWSNFYVPCANMVIVFVFMPAVLLVGILRRKI